MATENWDGAYEATPSNTDKRHLGDDEFRDMKKNVRESLQQGGHYDPSATVVPSTAENDRGRHVVDAGGAGVGPDIYQADATTKLVTYTDNGVLTEGFARFRGIVSLGDLATGITLTGPVTKTMTEAAEVTTVFICNTNAGDITVNLPAPSADAHAILLHKHTGANNLIIDAPSGSFSLYTERGTWTTPFTVPSGYWGNIILVAIAATEYLMMHDQPFNLYIDHLTTGSFDGRYNNIWVDKTAANATPNMPARSAENTGVCYDIHTWGSANQLILSPPGGDTINGGGSIQDTAAKDSHVRIVGDPASATNWVAVLSEEN